MVICLRLIVLQRWLSTRRSYAVVTGRSSQTPLRLGRWCWPIFLLMLVGTTAICLLPLGLLIAGSFMKLFGFFDLPQVPVQILPVPLEVDDRISDELPGSVKGDVPAALHLEHANTARLELGSVREEIRILRRATERNDWVVLDEKQEILRQRTTDPRPRRRSLELEHFRVIPSTQVDDPQRTVRRHCCAYA
jgi:hypothetical protein